MNDSLKSSSGTSSTVFAFELIFKSDLANPNESNSRYVWKCESETERNNFVNTLFKLSEEFLKQSDRPKFNNFNFEGKEQFIKSCKLKN